jgi:hypothetical protein
MLGTNGGSTGTGSGNVRYVPWYDATGPESAFQAFGNGGEHDAR